MPTKKMRRVFVALVAAALVIVTGSRAFGVPVLSDLYQECVGGSERAIIQESCCSQVGGDWVEIFADQDEGDYIGGYCTNIGEDWEESGGVNPSVFVPAPEDDADLSPGVESPKLDTIAPHTVVDSSPNSTIKKQTTFIFSTEPLASFECSLDGADFATCASPLTLTGLRIGAHTLQVVAIDQAGNRDASPAVSTFKVA